MPDCHCLAAARHGNGPVRRLAAAPWAAPAIVAIRRFPFAKPLKRPSSKTVLALLVAGLHAVLLLGALHLQAWQDRGPPALTQQPLIVWLQGAPRPNAAPPQDLPAPRPVLPAAPALPLPVRPATPANPQAITLPLPVPMPMPVPLEAPTTAPAPTASAPLNLALPSRQRGASAPWGGAGVERNPALDDPRSNSPKPTLESRIAAALGGSDQITEYRLEDGSVRLKRGNSCVVVRPNRASTLDPFNASAQFRPRLIDRC